jgi:serine protease Do
MRKTRSFFAGAGVALAAVLGVGLAFGLPGHATLAASPTVDNAAQVATALSDAYRRVALELDPSVVRIESVRTTETEGTPSMQSMPGSGHMTGPNGMLNPNFLRRFFGQQMTPPATMKETALGSGVIVSADGDILTNDHVVKGATEVRVKLSDGRNLKATVVGTDPATDLAVIRVKAEHLTPAKLGDSNEVEPGDLCVAMGSPFGLSQTLTAGIVSAKGRARVGIADYEDFIQTDAAINPGNSGGPLADMNGEVIGINTAIFSRAGGNNGIGLAIPVNMAKDVMHAILTTGHVVRGYLGVKIQDLTPGLSRSFSYKGHEGTLVAQVMPGSPASKAGLEKGDIITALDGKPVEDTLHLRNRVADLAPGTKTNITVFRNGDSTTIPLVIGTLGAETPNHPSKTRSNWDALGLSVEALTPDTARQWNVPSDLSGVLVTGVKPGSIADDAGLQSGDVILEVMGQNVKNGAGFRSELDKHSLSNGIRLRVARGQQRMYLFLQMKK